MRLRTNKAVVVLGGGLGALAILRSLGRLGVTVHAVDVEQNPPALRSRYCRQYHRVPFDPDAPHDYLSRLLRIAARHDEKPLLIPTTDDYAIVLADHTQCLEDAFSFPRNESQRVRSLANKMEMFSLAEHHGLPTPEVVLPGSRDGLLAAADRFSYPVLLKGVMGNRLQKEKGCKMLLVGTPEELVEAYDRLDTPGRPNLMLQEYIPGGDDQVYIFNGYFDDNSDCLAAFTGFKVRQYPIHFGSASLGECRWNPEVAGLTCRFMKQIGYRGILDIGYRLDPRDGQYKVLDINPRVGQAFRLFVTENGLDVVRVLYLDRTGQSVVAGRPQDGRRWMIEDHDIVSTWHYFREGTLRPLDWLKSFRGVREAAWFSWSDLRPFFSMMGNLVVRFVHWASKRLHWNKRRINLPRPSL